MAPAFTEASLASMQQYILPHLDEFFRVAPAEGNTDGGEKGWTADMAKWANYVTFDIMGDLVFGKDFGMKTGRESRELPSVIDAALHRQLLVSECLRPQRTTTAAKGEDF